MMVEIACLYTSWECPSRRNKTQKLSNQVTTPWSLTPFTRKIVSGVLFLRTLLRKVSWRFCARSAGMAVVSVFFQVPRPRCWSWNDPGESSKEAKSTTGIGIRLYRVRSRKPTLLISGWCPVSDRKRSRKFGVTVEFAAERCRDRAGRAIAQKLPIYPHHRQHDLTGGCHKCFACRLRLGQGEGTLVQLQPLRLDDLEHDGAGNSTQDAGVGRPRHHAAFLRHNPGVRRGALGHEPVPVDEPGFACALLFRILLGQDIGQQ